MSGPNVTAEEEKKYGNEPMPERQVKYCGGILKKNPNTTTTELKEALAWKFGACVLSAETLAGFVK